MTEKDSKLHTDEGNDAPGTGDVVSEEETWKQAEELARELKRGLEKVPGRNASKSSDETYEVTRECAEESPSESVEVLPEKSSKRISDEVLEKAGNEPEKKKPQPGNGKATSGAATKKKKKRTAASYAISFFIKIAVTALVVFLLLTFVVGLYVNHSNFSYPMLKDGDLCLTYRLATLVKGDEIAYEKEGTIRFGRIVGTAGDVVDINDGSITVNGYGVFEDAVYPTTAEGAKITFPYKVPEEAVFVLNDYRSDPTDSRAYGAIPLSETKGKVILVLRRRGI